METDILTTGREMAERYNRKGEGFDNIGKKNAYECEDCRAYIVTIDRAPGVTPLMTKCGNCSGMATSKMYRVSDRLTPTHEWYRPETLDGIPVGYHDHLSQGGLILREIDGETWQIQGPEKTVESICKDAETFASLKAAIKDAEKLDSVLSAIDFPKLGAMTRQQIRHAKRKGRDAPDEIQMYGETYRRVGAAKAAGAVTP